MLEEARADVAEARRTARPLTDREREAITALVLTSAREPNSTSVEFRGFSYELNGVRRADFLMNGRNDFGGMTAWTRSKGLGAQGTRRMGRGLRWSP